MLPLLHHGVSVRRNQLKGLYNMDVKRSKKSPGALMVVCTLRHCSTEACTDFDDEPDAGSPYGPITLCHQGMSTMLRPWGPQSCAVSAGIHNGLVCFPIRPRSRVFAIDCSLTTLSHLADIVGVDGRVVGVIDVNSSCKPTREELCAFHRRQSGVTAAVTDVGSATLETYELLLSLPRSSKYAFLMGRHPRLGASSPVRLLAGAPRHIVRKIFDFVESGDAHGTSCLVSRHWPKGATVDQVREMVLLHLELLERPRTSRGGDSVPKASKEERATTATDTSTISQDNANAKAKGLILDLPLDFAIAGDSQLLPDKNELSGVINAMQRHSDGRATGLVAREQMPLAPYFPNHALLVMKYDPQREERLTLGCFSSCLAASSSRLAVEAKSAAGASSPTFTAPSLLPTRPVSKQTRFFEDSAAVTFARSPPLTAPPSPPPAESPPPEPPTASFVPLTALGAFGRHAAAPPTALANKLQNKNKKGASKEAPAMAESAEEEEDDVEVAAYPSWGYGEKTHNVQPHVASRAPTSRRPDGYLQANAVAAAGSWASAAPQLLPQWPPGPLPPGALPPGAIGAPQAHSWPPPGLPPGLGGLTGALSGGNNFMHPAMQLLARPTTGSTPTARSVTCTTFSC